MEDMLKIQRPSLSHTHTPQSSSCTAHYWHTHTNTCYHAHQYLQENHSNTYLSVCIYKSVWKI